MIKTVNLQYSYPNSKSFFFPNFNLGPKENLLVLGDSGSGKTTFLHLLGLLLKPLEGNLEINGTQTHTLEGKHLVDFRARNIGIIYQKSIFIQSLTVKENLEMSLYLSKGQAAHIQSVLDSLGIAQLANNKTYELSGGEQQRLSIARALINKPSVILADEPTSALDDKNTEKVYDLMTELCQEAGSSLVIVSHDQRLKSKVKNQMEIV